MGKLVTNQILKNGTVAKFKDEVYTIIGRITENDGDLSQGLGELVYIAEIVEVVVGDVPEGENEWEFYHRELVEVISNGSESEFTHMTRQQLMMLRDIGAVDVNTKNKEYKVALERWTNICNEITYRQDEAELEEKLGEKPTRQQVSAYTYGKAYGGREIKFMPDVEVKNS